MPSKIAAKNLRVISTITCEDIARCVITEETMLMYERDKARDMMFMLELRDPEYHIARHKCKMLEDLHATIDEINALSVADISAIKQRGVMGVFFRCVMNMPKCSLPEKIDLVNVAAGKGASTSGKDLISVSVSSPQEVVQRCEAALAAELRFAAMDPQVSGRIANPIKAGIDLRIALLAAGFVENFLSADGTIQELRRDGEVVAKMCESVRKDKPIVEQLELKYKVKAEAILRPLLLIVGYELQVKEYQPRDGATRKRIFMLTIKMLHKQ
jgi:hypothetical protein